jgi:hypothetical protein
VKRAGPRQGQTALNTPCHHRNPTSTKRVVVLCNHSRKLIVLPVTLFAIVSFPEVGYGFGINDEISKLFWDKGDICIMRIMTHKGFDKLLSINLIFLCFEVIIISILLPIVFAISFILSTIFLRLSMLAASSLRFRLTSHHDFLRTYWGVSDDPHGLHCRAILRRKRKRKVHVRHWTTALSGDQSQLRGRRQLYYPTLLRKCQNVIPDANVGSIPHLCVRPRGGTKWLYGTNESYDKYGDNRLKVSADKCRGLCVKSSGGIQHLCATAESDIELGSGVLISRDQKMEDNSAFHRIFDLIRSMV